MRWPRGNKKWQPLPRGWRSESLRALAQKTYHWSSGRGYISKSPKPMSLLCLNFQALGKAQVVTSLRCIFEGCKTSMAFLSKTKVTSSERGDLVNKLDDYDGVFVDCRGHSGSLAMIWRKAVVVNLLSRAFNHINILVRWGQVEPEWRLTHLYGFPESYNKLKMCELILGLQSHTNLLWLVEATLRRSYSISRNKAAP